jgi:uncharacterized membrane-anchored protein YitT (DUF2179 family)
MRSCGTPTSRKENIMSTTSQDEAVFADSEIPEVEPTPVEIVWHPLGGIRVHWLNALIIGATVLVWLMLLAPVVGGVVLGIAASQMGGSGGSSGGTPGMYADPAGDSCLPSDTITIGSRIYCK